MNTRTIEELCQALLDGTASKREALELQEILRTNPDARRIYLEYAALQDSLSDHFSSTTTIPSRWTLPCKAGLAATARPQNLIPMLSALAAVLVVMLAIWTVWPRQEESIAEFKVSTESLYTLNNSKTGTEETKLLRGTHVSLKQGSMELIFSNGTRSVILGPAEFTLHEPNRITLDSGRAWFHVIDKEADFQVLTEQLDVRDLGTEFGVYASPIENDEVHVFRGSVEAKAHNATDSSRELSADQAMAITASGRLTTIPCKRNLFIDELVDGPPHLHFSFDRTEKGMFPVTGTLPEASEIEAKWQPGDAATGSRLVPGIKGTALQFNGGSSEVLTDWPGIAGNAPRTVTLWVKTDHKTPERHNPCIIGWGDYRMPNGKWKVLLSNEYSIPDAKARTSFGGYAYDAPITINDGQWHHLAFSYSGKATAKGHPDLAIYVDGVKQELTYREYPIPFRGNKPRIPNTATQGHALPLQIGGSIDESSEIFTGTIDEVYIYSGVLSEEFIRAQAEKK